MSAAAPELGDIDTRFAESLAADAGRVETGPPAAAPPRKSDNPDAPHGFEADGTTPKAPYGFKPDGRPRIKPGGPGRRAPRSADDTARVSPIHPGTPAGSGPAGGGGQAAADGPDFSEQLTDLGTTVWLGASVLRGGRLFVFPVPDARPYAAVWIQQLPGMVGAWNVAARQNSTVRGYVERLSGEGAWSWKVGVAVTMVGFAAACMEMAKVAPEVRAAAAAANDAELDRFMTAQIAELGLQPAELPGTGQAAA